MCYFMLAVSENKLDSKVMDKAEDARVYATRHGAQETGLPEGIYCYDINNGHCACELVVSPFSNIEEVRLLLSDLGSKGPFRFLVTDTEYEEVEDFFKAGEVKLEETDELIGMNELIKKYPHYLEHEKVYMVQA